MTLFMDALAPLRTSTDRPSLEGSLGDLRPAELIRLLGQTRQTGTLQVLADGPVLVTLVDGAVSYATNDPSRTLRDVLFVDGLIDDATWQKAVESGGDELGESLVEAGVAADLIRAAVRRAVLDVVVDLSLSTGGRFRFVAGRRHSLGERFHYQPIELGADLDVCMKQWDEIHALVPSFTAIAHLAPSLPPGKRSVTVTAADWRVLAALDGVRPLASLHRQLGSTRFALARSVATLVDAGMVTLEEPEVAAAG